MTSRQAFGKKQVPPRFWLPWLNCNDLRKVDLVDILYASSVRDAECVSEFMNLSRRLVKLSLILQAHCTYSTIHSSRHFYGMCHRTRVENHIALLRLELLAVLHQEEIFSCPTEDVHYLAAKGYWRKGFLIFVSY